MADLTDIKEPVAGLSAASSCIRISLSPPSPSSPPTPSSSPGEQELLQFRPVYTHQCFEKEFIPGWTPLLNAEQESRQICHSWKDNSESDDGELHKSYQHFRRDQPEEARLDVHVLLSPSCENCQIEIKTEKYEPTNNGGTEPDPKRVKKVTFGGIAPNDTQHDGTQIKQLDIEDIVKQKMSLAVPPIVSVTINGNSRNELVPTKEGNKANDKEESGSLGYLPQPIGQVLKTYHRKIKGGSRESAEESKFVIALADGSDPKVAKYHHYIQPLARWFIETADDVDLSDTSRGSWKVMYLFRCHDSPSSPQSTTLSLAGYITLLHVHSPFRKPRPGIIVRVCQALILPPYHRAGHASEMLNSVHDYANQHSTTEESSGMDILEINVEDPAPAFVALRDSVDYHRFVSFYLDDKTDMNYLTEYGVADKEYFLPVLEEHLSSVAESMKITKRQSQIVHEILKLQQLEKWKQSLGSIDKSKNKEELIQQVETNYRLMVKKTLRSLRKEELGACQGGKEEQKALLGRWFDEALSHYRTVLRSRIK
eukprot:CAMPEP_0172315592 /NCGR_PEP_ID=MMETSP1058-20130122/25683_1 /TAXON_ID=83371 /ORGANISM="Detonula confervacea, Strain CCMP 353" /LENGTH=538 /DNA_ID=CAMNT_0013029697 /DNA_START=1 /DNA_END=1617 /DNA_ORIENTATION=-